MSEVIYKQQEYYDIDAIEARLSEALGSDEWSNIKKTDLGQNLIKLGANIVHMDAMAFFTGLDQMFKSTVTQNGYLEEIAKSKGVIPKTYISASLTLSLYAKSSIQSFLPMDFSLRVGGKTFYNISDVTIGQSGSPATLVLYEGSVVREASEAGRPLGSSWSYTQFKAIQSEKIGDKVVRKFIILPREVFVDSIIVETSNDWNVPFVRWNKVKTWYGTRQTDRAWKLGKDFLGRYIIEFGDGVYGKEYPTSEIVGIRYVLSGGSGISVDNFDNMKLYSQDVNDMTNNFVIGGVSNLVDGQSEVNTQDLHLEIEAADNTRDSLISETDHKNYLEGRADVLYASIKAERHADPPNIEYFNTMTYAIKPNADGGTFNDADIQNYLGKNGLETVEYKNVQVKRENFNIVIRFAALAGYTASGIQSQIQSIVDTSFSWTGLGFDETISEERIYSLIKDVEGLDVQSLEIAVVFVYTNEETGETEFDFNISDVIPLRFYPRRFRMYLNSETLVSGTTARDNGSGGLYGDIQGREKFSYSSGQIAANSFNFGNLMLLGNGGSNISYIIDLRKGDGAVSKIAFLDTVLASCWCSRYSELVTMENDSGTYTLRSYSFPASFFDIDGFNYIQLKDIYTYATAKKELALSAPGGASGIGAIAYFDSYIYVVWHMGTGNHRLYRYRIMAGSIESEDSSYNSVGYLELSEKDCRSIVPKENVFSGSQHGLLISTDTAGTTESGLDIVIDFDIADDCVFESDFFNASLTAYTFPFDWWGLSTDGNSLYAVIAPDELGGKTVIAKLYSMNNDGTCSVKILSDNAVDDIRCAVFSIYNSVGEVFGYSIGDRGLYKVGFDDLNEPMVQRAGNGVGDLTSIAEIGTINYDLQELVFGVAITGELKYESENDLVFDGEEMPILKDLTIYQK